MALRVMLPYIDCNRHIHVGKLGRSRYMGVGIGEIIEKEQMMLFFYRCDTEQWGAISLRVTVKHV